MDYTSIFDEFIIFNSHVLAVNAIGSQLFLVSYFLASITATTVFTTVKATMSLPAMNQLAICQKGIPSPY